MSKIMHALFIASLVVSATACAMDGQDEQGSLSETSESAALPAPSIDAAQQAGWELLDATELPVDLPDVDSPDGDSSRACTVITSGVGGACPRGFACLYQNSNRKGLGVGISAGCGSSDLRAVRCPSCTNGIHGNNGTFNDQMSSWHNASGRRYCWYFDINFRGERHTMGNGVIQNVLPRENDRASSFKPC
ncbi:MAG TPA: peptidase inhibitor family I36 protein [Kofleriaceae bacterium]